MPLEAADSETTALHGGAGSRGAGSGLGLGAGIPARDIGAPAGGRVAGSCGAAGVLGAASVLGVAAVCETGIGSCVVGGGAHAAGAAWAVLALPWLASAWLTLTLASSAALDFSSTASLRE